MQKNSMRILVSIMLIISSVFGQSALAASSTQDFHEYSGGYVSPPIDLSYLADNPPIEIEEVDDSPFPIDKAATPPSKYDLRNVNGKSYVTSVKSQSPHETCWAFSAIGAMESNYLMQGGSALDLSEMHLAWFAFKNSDKSKALYDRQEENLTTLLSHGGNSWYPTALYTRLDGPVLESDLSYSSQPSRANPQDYSRVLRLKDVYYLAFDRINVNASSANRTNVKKRIMETGAVMASYKNDNSSYQKTDSGGTAFYTTTKNETNHAILLVGWDDSYSKNNFKTKPKSNGAWLVKNSWGSQWGSNGKAVGDDGYFWMSYEQYLTDGTAYVVEEVNPDMKAYYYDALGWTASYGGTSNKDIYSANVFKSERNEENLTEVGFYSPDNNQKYEIRVYKGGSSMLSSGPMQGSLTETISGTITYAGYHTIKLNNPVSLSQGDYFAVVLVLKGTKTTPVEMKGAGMTPNAVIEPGTFFSQNGSNWTPGTTANACIKAFTVAANSTPTPPKILTSQMNDAIINTQYSESLSASGTRPITWSVASGKIPAGMALSSSGILSGTPTETGEFTFSVTATNNVPGSDSSTITLKVLDLPAISPTSFSAYAGTAFNQTLKLSYGTATKWTAENLPAGLTLKANTGVISGKPSKEGTYTASVSAVTSSGTSRAYLTFTIGPKPTKPTIKTSSLPKGAVGESYSESLVMTGTTPITLNASGLPNGMNFNASTGTISGTPKAEGTFNITIEASNAATDKPVTKKIKLVVTAAPPVIDLPDLEDGLVNKAYDDVQFTTSSGNGTIKWSASGMPTGMKFSTSGVLSGTPKKAGKFTLKVKAQNSGGNETVSVPITILQLPEITTKKLTDATTDKAYTLKLTAKGTTPITWDFEGLPDTLNVTTEKDGTIATIKGTPVTAENCSVKITAENSAGPVSVTLPLTVKGVAPKVTAKLAVGSAGDSYAGSAISATGTKPITFTYSIAEADQKKFGIQTLEELGLELTANPAAGTAEITGIPDKSVKALPITLKAANSVSSVTKKVNLTIKGDKPVFDSPSNNEIFTQDVKSDVNIAFSVSGTSNITFSMNNVAGLKLNQTGENTAEITGIAPDKAKSTAITVTAANADGKATRKITLKTVVSNKALPEPLIAEEPEPQELEPEQAEAYEPEIVSVKQDTSGPALSFGTERTALSLRMTEREMLEREGYIIAEVLPEISVNESGMHEIEIEFDESVESGAKLFWFAFPKDAPSSEDDEIVEFYDEAGAEIEEVPENRIIIVSAWFNQGVTYAPVIAVK